jgi:DnaJ-class molecular chaperone
MYSRVAKGTEIHFFDLVYILKEKEHDLFKRDGDNLCYKAKIPLGKALVGCSVEVPTLDGRLLAIPLNDIGKYFELSIQYFNKTFLS